MDHLGSAVSPANVAYQSLRDGQSTAFALRIETRYDPCMARQKGRNRKGRQNRWDDADAWQPSPETRSRRNTKGRGRGQRAATVPPAPAFNAPPPFSLLPSASPDVKTCGRCQEWIGDELGGRGECLHPGSGILRPWWDTPACPFFH
jgi:hypothetical protein